MLKMVKTSKKDSSQTATSSIITKPRASLETEKEARRLRSVDIPLAETLSKKVDLIQHASCTTNCLKPQ